jgi:hypothetical protein
LEEQKLLLKDSNHSEAAGTWVKDGQLTRAEKQQRVVPWCRVNAPKNPIIVSVATVHPVHRTGVQEHHPDQSY